MAELGGLDLLVNNVATQEPVDDLTKLSTEQWDRTFRVNIYSYFWTSRAALRRLPEGGVIINTASINGLRGNKARHAGAAIPVGPSRGAAGRAHHGGATG